MSRTRTRRSRAHSVTTGLANLKERIRGALKEQPWWYTTIMVIGFVTLITAVSVLFLGVNSAPRHISTTAEVPRVDSVEFGTALARLVNAPLEHGGTVQVLDNGDGFFPELVRAIDGARSTINFSVYIWSDGAVSDQVLDALIRKQRQGVQVRVLLDGLGAIHAPDGKFEELKNAGAQIQKFRMPKFGSWTRFHRRNHRRSIVIDGRVGFTGGMAVSDSWLGHAQDPDHWRDMMFKVTGPLASSLQSGFADRWAGSAGELLVGPGMYPPDALSEPGVEAFVHHVNSPADDDQSMANFILMPILAARERVYIVTPYFIPDDPLQDALKDKARAGVDVRLLAPGPNIDNSTVRWSGHNHYDGLMEAGVRIYEYQPTFIHSKAIVVDGRWTVIGSPNLNSRSRHLDEENAFGILDATLAAQLEAAFLKDLERSEQITLEKWKKRGLVDRALELFSRLLDQQS